MKIKLAPLSTGNNFQAPTKKACTKCKEEKPIAGFRKNNKIKDGYMNVCKTCERSREKARSAGDPEYAKHFFVHTEAF
jgi:hypothetical protein